LAKEYYSDDSGNWYWRPVDANGYTENGRHIDGNYYEVFTSDEADDKWRHDYGLCGPVCSWGKTYFITMCSVFLCVLLWVSVNLLVDRREQLERRKGSAPEKQYQSTIIGAQPNSSRRSLLPKVTVGEWVRQRTSSPIMAVNNKWNKKISLRSLRGAKAPRAEYSKLSLAGAYDEDEIDSRSPESKSKKIKEELPTLLHNLKKWSHKELRSANSVTSTGHNINYDIREAVNEILNKPEVIGITIDSETHQMLSREIHPEDLRVSLAA
jgi:hypothetical protein